MYIVSIRTWLEEEVIWHLGSTSWLELYPVSPTLYRVLWKLTVLRVPRSRTLLFKDGTCTVDRTTGCKGCNSGLHPLSFVFVVCVCLSIPETLLEWWFLLICKLLLDTICLLRGLNYLFFIIAHSVTYSLSLKLYSFSF